MTMLVEILRANALRMTTLIGITTGFSRNPQNDKLKEMTKGGDPEMILKQVLACGKEKIA